MRKEAKQKAAKKLSLEGRNGGQEGRHLVSHSEHSAEQNDYQSFCEREEESVKEESKQLRSRYILRNIC